MEQHMNTARLIAKMMDSKFNFLGIKFGLDPFLNLFPFVGDGVAALIALYLVWIAIQIRVPQHKIAEMIFNVVIDFLIGLVPVLGEVGDLLFRANEKNMKILERYYVPVTEGEIINDSSSSKVAFR